MHRENEKEKKLWSVTTISDMLKNEVYLGKIIWNKREWQEQEAINWFPMIKKSGLL